MLTWAEFNTSVRARLNKDSLNPNDDLQELIDKSILDAVIDLQRIPGLREHHESRFSPALLDKVNATASQFILPSGFEKASGLFYQKAFPDAETPQNTLGFFMEGFLTPSMNGFYQRTGSPDIQEGIDGYDTSGPEWFRNTTKPLYSFRLVKFSGHGDDGIFPALFIDNTVDYDYTVIPLDSGMLYYLSNPLTEDGEDGPAYAPWRSDGAPAWKDAKTGGAVAVPEAAVGESWVRRSFPLTYVVWPEFTAMTELNVDIRLSETSPPPHSCRIWSSQVPGRTPITVGLQFASRHDRLLLRWSGRKKAFEDADVTPFDEEVAFAASLFVKEIVQQDHHQKRLTAKEYGNRYKMARRDLYLRDKERREGLAISS